jgi:two-component system sensor histidine kinase BarA
MKFLRGIRFQLLLLGILPASILAFSLTFWFIQTRIGELDKALSERGEIIVKNLAPASLYGVFSGSDYLIQRLADNLVLEQDVIEVSIYNKKGQRRAHAKRANYNNASTPSNEISFFSHPILLSIMKDEENDPFSTLLEVSIDNKQLIGEVKVILSRASTLAGQKKIMFTSIIITALGLFISLLLAYRLSRRISEPVLSLTNTVNQVSKGDLSVRSNINALEELNELKQGLNAMAESLEKNQTQLVSKIKSATLALNHSLHSLEDKNRQLDLARQQAESSNRQKSQFLAHMSHEIRTPMNGILGFLQLLGDSSLSPGQSNQLQLVETSANNLLTIINEILDHAELESSNLKLTFSDFDLRRSIEETAALLAPLADKKRIQLILLIDESVPKLLNSDPIRLRQILFNLLGNSIKFTESGRVIIRVRLQNNSLLFTVSDTGQGIPDREQQNLFAPFSQVETTEEFPPPGTGLGLNIAQSITSALKGEIGFASKENLGTTFWFTLPQENCSQKPEDTRIQPAQFKQALLWDDNKLTRLSISQQLLSIGVTTTDTTPEKLKQITLDNELSNYDYLIINDDSTQHTDNLNNIGDHLPVLILSYISKNNRNSSNESCRLQLPCSQTALLEALTNRTGKREPETHSPKAHTLKSQTNLQPDLRFLVADDIEINRLLLIEQIKPHWNASIIEAKDGEEALEVLKKQNFDLVFLDLRMPKMSGLSALKSLMATPEALNHETPFIAITAYLPENSKEELIASGFSTIILKPFLENNLVETVNELLKLSKSRARRVDSKENHLQSKNNSLLDSLVDKMSGNQKLACSLLDKLNDDLPKQLKAAQHALKVTDLNEAQEAIHRIHGSACYFEISELVKISNELEAALTNTDLESANALFPLLEKEIVQFIKLSKKAMQKTET